ncbi:MAG: T9SS type A sorting domain-containing protein [Dysgonamonadaceae bacterium]|jgi:hypothetical protein|nr:T9SS type A sorting domain-containing protein [Dysgonamonadaceae bacterium]
MKRILTLLFGLIMSISMMGQTVRYVSVSAAGTGDGSSWSNASGDLQAMINASSAGDEVHVSAGTYIPKYTADGYDESTGTYPTATNGKNKSAFVLKNGVAVRGGYDANDANETQDWITNKTILSGDLTNDGTPNTNDAAFVVIAVGVSSSTVLDGFTVSGANTSGSVTVNGQAISTNGVGISCYSASPVLRNLIVSGNKRYGIYNNSSSSPEITQVTVSGNANSGIYNNSSSPEITQVLVTENGAGTSTNSGIYNTSSSPTLTNVTVSGNNGYGIYNASSSAPEITQVLVSGNSTNGIYNNASSPILTNVTISGNNGAGFANAGTGSAPTVKNSIIYGNSSNISSSSINSTTFYNSIVQGLGGSNNQGWAWPTTSGGTNYDFDPGFVSPVDYSEAPTSTGDYSLVARSQAVGKGDNSYLTGITADLAGNQRIVGTNIDPGAYEVQNPFPLYSGTVYVDANATGAGDGTSWADAATELADVLHYARIAGGINEIRVAEGTYKPKFSADGVTMTAAAKSFVLVDGVSIYGGYDANDANETQDWITNKTILSGDLNGNGEFENNTDAAFVVIAVGVSNSTVLDGFTVSGANTSGSVTVNGQAISTNGVGISCYSASPILRNLIVSGNKRYGIYNSGSTPEITQVTVCENANSGIYNDASSPVITQVIANGNTVCGIYNNNSLWPIIAQTLVSGNGTGTNTSAGIYNASSSPLLSNVTISGNNGYGIYNKDSSAPKVSNSIIYGNNKVVNDASGSSTTYSYSIIQGLGGSNNQGWAWPTESGSTNYDFDPMFVAPADYAAAPTTAGDYSLVARSQAAGKGDNSYLDSGITADLAGNSRIVGTNIDPGAYEIQNPVPLYSGTVYVDANATGAGAGTSWADAAPELADVLHYARVAGGISKIYVAKGTYKPKFSADGINTNTNARSFVLVSGVDIYGGYDAETGTRDLVANPTILSGDLNNSDSANKGDAAYIVIAVRLYAVLDGFTISGAFGDNSTEVDIDFIHPSITTTANSGAGIFCYDMGNPSLQNLIVSGNKRYGIYNDVSSPTITQVLVSGNGAGGIYNVDGSAPVLANVTIGGNYGYGFFGDDSVCDVFNSIIYGNQYGANFGFFYNSIIQGYGTSGNNYNFDPMFVAPVTPSTTPTTTGDYSLAAGSPAAGKGDNSLLATVLADIYAEIDTDLAGNQRIVGTNIDPGAYEIQNPASYSGTVYVDANVLGGDGSGISWENAVPELADVLNYARYTGGINEIRVAKGTYLPKFSADGANTTAAAKSFVLVDGVNIYGGYDAASDTRNWAANPTVLSGDLNNDSISNAYDATYLVIAAGLTNPTVLDGFTVSGAFNSTVGNITVNGQEISTNIRGVGIFCYSDALVLKNLVVSGNKAYGIYNSASSPEITQVLISGNGTNGIVNNNSSPTLTNVTISGNNGAGFANQNISAPTVIKNSIIYGNNTNVTVNNNSMTCSYSLIQGRNPSGTGNINDISAENNPLFVNPIAYTAPTTEGNYRIQRGSPVIDKGDNSALSETTDLAGRPRKNGTIDIGAYEQFTAVWNGASGNDFYNAGNWNGNLSPSADDEVIISGSAANFPILASDDNAQVRNITFEPGAEIGRQDLLNYDKAFVQLDFSSANSRNRWWMMGNPFQELFVGDLNFGGYPSMDLKQFLPDAGGIGRWSAYPGITKKFGLGESFDFWLYPDTREGDFGLNLTGGIIEFPYFNNPNVPAAVHWTHTYYADTQESTFTGWSSVSNIPTPNGTFELIQRDTAIANKLADGDLSKALIFGKGTDGLSGFATVGNPYMSSIDFAALKNDNSFIKSSYQIWIGSGKESGGRYAGYNTALPANEGEFGYAGQGLNGIIAPVQGFMVEIAEGESTENRAIQFNIENITSNVAKNSLRSSNPQDIKVLSIKAQTADDAAVAKVAAGQSGSLLFGNNDSYKIMGTISEIPEIYSLKTAKNGLSAPVAVNLLPEISEETNIPLGIYSTFKGNMNITFSGMNRFDGAITLIDNELNKVIPLAGDEKSYDFNYTPPVANGKNVADESRFVLKISGSLTGNEIAKQAFINVFSPDKGIISLISTELLLDVKIVDLQGKTIATQHPEGLSATVQNLSTGTYIVKATTKSGVKIMKITVK